MNLFWATIVESREKLSKSKIRIIENFLVFSEKTDVDLKANAMNPVNQAAPNIKIQNFGALNGSWV